MKNIIKTAAVLALIAPTATFASGVYDFPSFSTSDFSAVSSEKAVQPVTKLDISTANEIVISPSEAKDQK